MNRCTRVRALRSCSGDVHVARVVVSLVVHAVVGLTLGLIAHVVVVVFVVAILHRICCIWRYTLYTHHAFESQFSTWSCHSPCLLRSPVSTALSFISRCNPFPLLVPDPVPPSSCLVSPPPQTLIFSVTTQELFRPSVFRPRA